MSDKFLYLEVFLDKEVGGLDAVFFGLGFSILVFLFFRIFRGGVFVLSLGLISLVEGCEFIVLFLFDLSYKIIYLLEEGVGVFC